MTYIFGNDYSNTFSCEAKTMELAIKVFKIDVLFPEKMVDTELREGYGEYDSDLGRYEYKWKSTPMIPIFTMGDDREQTKVGEVSLYDCINVDFDALNPIKRIGYDAPTEESKELVTKSQFLIDSNLGGDIRKGNKVDLRKMSDAIAIKKAELEAQKRELQKLASAMEEELKEKRKMIYVIETFLGLREEIHTLVEGVDAPEDEPLSIYQMKLYMDEEVGLWEDEGIDYNNIEEFDAWVIKNYGRFLYKEKSVMAWQIRRREKRSSEDYDPFTRAAIKEENNKTYLLIRNGSSLYRIWSDVGIGERLFPQKNEYEKIMNRHGGSFIDSQKREVKRNHERYMYGFVAIQGIIERTPVLGTTLRNNVNLMEIGGFTDEYVKLIRDDESEYWLSDGKPSWHDFISKNRESIDLGTRVVLTLGTYEWYRGDDSKNWRTDPFRVSAYNLPNYSEVYTVDATKEKEDWYTYGDLSIKFLPNDTIYDEENWMGRERKRRVSFKFYKSECINYDDITLEDCIYYEQNRWERQNYIDILPVVHHIKKLKAKERELEDNFIKYIQTQVEMNHEEIREHVRWWKLKNKWKRELTSDDAKAVRMIIKKIKGGDNEKKSS